MEDALSTTPVTFSQDGTRLLCITSVGTDTAELAWFDVTTGEREFVAGDPTYDVASAALHIDTYEPRVVFFLRERLHAQILDETITEDMATLTALDDGGDLAILGSDNADTVWLVAKSNDNAPTRYYTYDRASRAVRFLFTTQPALERYQLAKKEPITVIARDGLQLHGYVTFPPGVQHRGLPAVLKVHGGPWSRDVWGLDAEAQWMANRGYACIEINFRGSRGYGKAFLNAGNREWGAKMQDDLLDAVDWTVAQGWVDPNRVAIYGGSYGGYAALVAATFTPDRFACAVAMAAPVNLITLIKAFPNFLKPMIAQAHVRVGNPDTDADFLWSRSPLSRAGDIGIPVLLVQGVNDPRVPQDECDQIRTALDAKGIAYDYLQFEDGHGLARPQDRERFSLAVERFLGEHLGGRVETTQHAQPASL
jgi:dipeptidyl aminopeptidase/acylaminoacyl peptidase